MTVEYYLAAATTVVLTPSAGQPMSGYLGREGRAEGTLDELEANLLWVSSAGTEGILWISLDVLAISPLLRKTIVDSVIAVSGIPHDRIVITASHTHSAPGSWHEQIHPAFPDDYAPALCVRLASELANLAEGLTAAAQPARLTWRAGKVRSVGSNRHRPDGPHDPTLGLLEVKEAATGKRIGLMFDYACHPTVLGPENLLWSADWVTGARRSVRGTAAGKLPIVFLQGCAADVSTRFFRNERTPMEVLRLGGRVGRCITDLLSKPGRDLAPSHVRVDRTTFHLPVRDLEIRESPSSPVGASCGDRLSASLAEGRHALEMLRGAALPDCIDLPVSVVTVGDRRWMHLPVEMCATYGLAIAAGSDDIRVIGYTDAYRGYIADRESFREGQYEALASYFDEETCHRFMLACRDYLGSVYEMSRS